MCALKELGKRLELSSKGKGKKGERRNQGMSDIYRQITKRHKKKKGPLKGLKRIEMEEFQRGLYIKVDVWSIGGGKCKWVVV